MNELNNKTRIKLRFSLNSLCYQICLQRKKWWGWKTVSYNYPSVFKDSTCEQIKDWLFWDEQESIKLKCDMKNQKIIGKGIMNSCKDSFSSEK